MPTAHFTIVYFPLHERYRAKRLIDATDCEAELEIPQHRTSKLGRLCILLDRLGYSLPARNALFTGI